MQGSDVVLLLRGEGVDGTACAGMLPERGSCWKKPPQTRSDVPITNYSVYPIYLAWHALSARKRTIAHGAVSDFTIISNICNMRSRR